MHFAQRTFWICCAALLMLLASGTIPAQGPASQGETPAATMSRAAAAHGNKWANGQVVDSVADGKLTLFAADGSPKVTLDVSLLRKKGWQLQRIVKQAGGELRQGSDGTNSWESAAGFFTPAAQGRALFFIESQTVRSIEQFLDSTAQGMTLRGQGKAGNASVVEAEDRQGRKTSYHVDSSSGLVNKLEFVVGQAKDPFSGAMVPVTDTYVFSDYRTVQGLATPFKIERSSNGNKLEEMQFASVRYNVGLKDQDFRH